MFANEIAEKDYSAGIKFGDEQFSKAYEYHMNTEGVDFANEYAAAMEYITKSDPMFSVNEKIDELAETVSNFAESIEGDNMEELYFSAEDMYNFGELFESAGDEDTAEVCYSAAEEMVNSGIEAAELNDFALTKEQKKEIKKTARAAYKAGFKSGFGANWKSKKGALIGGGVGAGVGGIAGGAQGFISGKKQGLTGKKLAAKTAIRAAIGASAGGTLGVAAGTVGRGAVLGHKAGWADRKVARQALNASEVYETDRSEFYFSSDTYLDMAIDLHNNGYYDEAIAFSELSMDMDYLEMQPQCYSEEDVEELLFCENECLEWLTDNFSYDDLSTVDFAAADGDYYEFDEAVGTAVEANKESKLKKAAKDHWKGAAIGGAVGTATGGGIGYATGKKKGLSGVALAKRTAAGAALGGLTGTVVGAGASVGASKIKAKKAEKSAAKIEEATEVKGKKSSSYNPSGTLNVNKYAKNRFNSDPALKKQYGTYEAYVKSGAADQHLQEKLAKDKADAEYRRNQRIEQQKKDGIQKSAQRFLKKQELGDLSTRSAKYTAAGNSNEELENAEAKYAKRHGKGTAKYESAMDNWLKSKGFSQSDNTYFSEETGDVFDFSAAQWADYAIECDDWGFSDAAEYFFSVAELIDACFSDEATEEVVEAAIDAEAEAKKNAVAIEEAKKEMVADGEATVAQVEAAAPSKVTSLEASEAASAVKTATNDFSLGIRPGTEEVNSIIDYLMTNFGEAYTEVYASTLLEFAEKENAESTQSVEFSKKENTQLALPEVTEPMNSTTSDANFSLSGDNQEYITLQQKKEYLMSSNI